MLQEEKPIIERKAVAYYRVSTERQGQSGLGLEAQRATVAAYLGSGSWNLVQEFVEIETGKGANPLDRRPQLKSALDACRRHDATLLIAKLDRLARNVHFVSGLLEAGCDFVAADMPQANKVMIQMYAVMSEWERDQISARTKSALAAAKARGVTLGSAGPANLRRNVEQRQRDALAFSMKLRPVLIGMQLAGLSKSKQVAQLNLLGITAPAGGRWSRTQLYRVLRHLDSQSTEISSIGLA